MSRRSSRRILASLAALTILGCQPDPGGSIYPETAVFPNEARLGGTVAIAIDSNYLPVWDSLEHYDLDRSRVMAFVRDDAGVELQATVRSVFPLSVTPAAWFASDSPGRWVMVALLDLPASGLQVPSNHARVQVFVWVGQTLEYVSHGTIKLVGDGGTPWLNSNLWYESGLESRSLLRLRAVRRDPQTGSTSGPPDAFRDSWQIGGIEFEVEYPDCLKPPEAFSNSEAVLGTALVSVPDPLATPPKARVVLFAPQGFTVKRPNDPYITSSAPNEAGEGPILDLAFDRVSGGATCSLIDPSDFVIRKLFVTDKNGDMLIDRRTGDTDSSDLFTTFVIDAEAS